MREKGFLILLMAGVLMGWAVDALGEPVSQDNPQIIPEAPPVSTDALEVVLVEQIAVDGQVTGYTVWYEDGSGMSFPADPPPISGNPSSGAVVGAGPTGAIGAVSAVVSPPDDTTADEPPQPAEPPVTLPPTEEQAGSPSGGDPCLGTTVVPVFGPTGAIGAVSAVVSPPDDTTADEPPQPAEPPVTLPPTEEQAGSATAPPAVN